MAIVATTRDSGGPSTRRWRQAWQVGGAAAITILISVTLYALTMPPSITWWFGGSDTGDLAVAADVLGIPHPTGYPLFVLLGHLATRVPVGEIAGRLNAMNALLAALGAGGIVLTIRALNRGTADAAVGQATAAMLGALAIASSGLYWSQAIIGEVYALHAALTVLPLWLWARRATPPVLLGAAHGLALTNHVTSTIVLAAALLVFAGRRRPIAPGRPTVWFVIGLLGPLALYALLPVRAAADPSANWGDPDTPGRFLAHVTGREYRHFLDWWDPGGTARDLLALFRLLAGNLPPWTLPAAALGFGRLRLDRPAYARFTALSGAGVLLFTAMYRSPDRAPYLLPLYIVTGIWSGVGLTVAMEAIQRWAAQGRPLRWLAPSAGGAVLLLTALWAVRTGARVNLHGDDSAVVFARATLTALPPEATYYTSRDDVTFALWYAQRSLGIRTDVRVVDVRNPRLRGVP